VRQGARSADLWGIPAGHLLVALLVIGLLLRGFIAGILLPQSGFRIDTGDFTTWAMRLAAGGPGEFYETGYFADYPPGYLYVLWGLGSIGAALEPVFGLNITGGLVKLPGIFGDLGAATLLFLLCRRYFSDRVAIAAAAAVLFNPGTIFNSSVWGQVDSVGTAAIIGTVYLLARGWTEAAGVGAVLALLLKFQYAFLIPVVALVGLKRHLFGRSSDAELHDRRDPLRVLTSLAAGLATLVLLILPYGMTIWAPGDPNHSLWGKFTEAASTYPGTTINAFNLWMNPFSGLAGTGFWGCDLPPNPPTFAGCGVDAPGLLIGGVLLSWQLIGAALFVAVAAFALWRVWRRDDVTGVLLACLLLAVAFFVLPTRVHERYLFPALVLAAPFVLRGWRGALLYAGISLSFFMNVYWTYTYDWLGRTGSFVNPGLNGQPMQRDPLLDATLISPAGIYLLSAGIVVLLGWLIWLMHSDAFGAAARGVAPVARPVRSPVPTITATPAVPPGTVTGLGRWIPSWLRTDRSDPFFREPHRRLDRMDLAILVGLVVLAFVFRVWRLDIPRSQHFDEVYHGRSATEWLADWNNGWTRDTYEWTHPMLAKYLIAAGIVAANPNQVVDRTDTAAPPAALAVAVQRTAAGHEGSVAFTASGTTLTARDAVNGQEVASWPVRGSVTALAFDDVDSRLFVGYADGGTIDTFALADFLATEGPRAPPEQAGSFETSLAGIAQLELPVANDQVLLVRGSGGVAALERTTGAELGSYAVEAGGIGYVKAVAEHSPAMVAVTDMASGTVVFLDAATLQPANDLQGEPIAPVEVPVTLAGPFVIVDDGENQRIFLPAGPLEANDEHGVTQGSLAIVDADQPRFIDTAPLPGAPSLITWNAFANIVYVAGTQNGQGAVWPVEPHGDDAPGNNQDVGYAAFDTTLLGGQPLSLALDVSKHAPEDDHERLLVATATDSGGALVAVDAGSNAFAWRFAGVVFGSLLVGLIYLFAATLFGRRRIAVLAGLFFAFDSMSYVMSRIAMNDIFVAFFIVAAYLVFWQVWSGRWARSAWWALPLTGVLIGLAAASKWTGFYALAGLLVLALARSQLGRLLLVGLVAIGAVVGGIGAPWPFLVLMLLGLALALFIVYQRPVRLGPGDLLALPATGAVLGVIGLAFAVAYPTIEGARNPGDAVELVFSVLARGAQAGWPVLVMGGAAAALMLLRTVRSLAAPASDRWWWQPSSLGGFGWAWIGACLVILPLIVYGLLYLPYLALGHAWAGPGSGPGYGWTVDELHSQMFGYHFGLQAGHPASSPWWSWPLDLKPVWFHSADFDGARMQVIYNGGNPLLTWAGVPAIILAGLLAWRRRSLAFVLLVMAFAFQWLPWVRIERASFMYHYFTAVPFALIAVAAFVDEGMRRPWLRDVAIAFLAAAVIVGILLFPLAAALPMPDWYINATRTLPPWNYYFQFPEPPQGERGALLDVSGLKLVVGGLVAAAAVGFALLGRDLLGGCSGRGGGGALGMAGRHGVDS
jgi:Gpi18-like mannosyltransferase/predicted membrane-bound dolichyl-phosphate-mannose-protein mannosyltransferase